MVTAGLCCAVPCAVPCRAVLRYAVLREPCRAECCAQAAVTDGVGCLQGINFMVISAHSLASFIFAYFSAMTP